MTLLKKAVYDKLVTKVDNIDTSDFVSKTNYNTEKTKKKQTIILKLQTLKINLMIIIMINILILQTLIL